MKCESRLSAFAPHASARPPATARFLTREACLTIAQQAARAAAGGGETTVQVISRWSGNLRWARNAIISSGEWQNDTITASRNIRGAEGSVVVNSFENSRLQAAVRRAEQLLARDGERPGAVRYRDTFVDVAPQGVVFSDATFNFAAAQRVDLMRTLVEPAQKAGLFAAGYVQLDARGVGAMGTQKAPWYDRYTQAQYSVTVRDPAGTASGWAGVSDVDWNRIDAVKLSQIALEKCQRSRNPVRVEPGRYTAILEPQAVCDLIKLLLRGDYADRVTAELGGQRNDADKTRIDIDAEKTSVFGRGDGRSRVGERIIDERLTVTTDPLDPDLAFPTFLDTGPVFHPATWIKDGVLHELAYFREYAVQVLGKNTGGLPASGGFKITAKGPTVTVEEMIATTKRGLLITRFSDVELIDSKSALMAGFTRDGLWLVENGQITKAVKNFRFTESPLFALNNIEQIGVSQRTFRPEPALPWVFEGSSPVMVPALKVRDFSFTSVSDSV